MDGKRAAPRKGRRVVFFWGGVCTCRAGPMCPAAGYAFFGGARGPRPTGRHVELRVGDGVPAVPHRTVLAPPLLTQKKKRPRAFLFLCKQGWGKNRAMRDGGDAVPYTQFNMPSRRAGPACPAEKCVPGGGTHGSRPTGAYPPPKKNNAAPLAGRRAFSVHVWHRRRRVIFAAFTSGNRGGKPGK